VLHPIRTVVEDVYVVDERSLWEMARPSLKGADWMNAADFLPYLEQVVLSADLSFICDQFRFPMDNRKMSSCVRCGKQSLYINQRMRGFRCVTSECNDQGDAISLVQRFTGLPFAQALGILDKNQWQQYWTEDFLNTFGAVRDCMTAAAVFFARRLDDVVPYLNGRGLPRDLCASFLVGAGLGIDNLRNHLLERRFPIEIIRLTGLLNHNDQDLFQEHVVIPLRQYGQVFDSYVRYIGNDPGMEQRSYLPQERLVVGRGYFNWNPNREQIILVDDVLDAMSLFHHHHQNVVATGANILDPMRLSGTAIRRAWVCLMADEAAREREIRTAQGCVDAGVEVRIIEMPGGLSPNDFFLRHSDADFTRLFGSARTFERWHIDHPR